jgi:hypothetical protein
MKQWPRWVGKWRFQISTDSREARRASIRCDALNRLWRVLLDSIYDLQASA